MAKNFINKIEESSPSRVLNVAVNKSDTGVLVECLDYLAYLPLANKNAIALLAKLVKWVDSEAGHGLVVEPDPKLKEGFYIRADDTEAGFWIRQTKGYYSWESLEEDESKAWDLELEKKTTKTKS